jgi:ribonuclease Z
MRRIAFRIVVVIFALGLTALIALRKSETLQDLVAERIAARRVLGQHDEFLDGRALRVFFCGTGAPLPDPKRGQACIAVFAGDTLLLVDAGAGAWDRFVFFRVPIGSLDGVLFTHFHSDHISGLPDIALNSWVAGRSKPLLLYGGPGVEKIAAGFAAAYEQDNRYRTAHHGPELLPPSAAALTPVTVEVPQGTAPVEVLAEGDLLVRAFRVHHPPVEPAYGYRIDYKGRSVIFSGDTARSETMEKVGRDVDVMVHEALAPALVELTARTLERAGDGRRAKILRDTPDYHTTPVEAAEVANAARARLLVISHLVPPVEGTIPESIFMRGVDKVRSNDTLVAHDGLLIELPVGSDEIRKRSLEH